MSEQLLAESRAAGRRRIGELLVLRGLLDEQEVASALVEQRHSKRRLGQILVDRGVLSSAALESTLAEQASRLEPEPGFGGGLRGAIDVQSIQNRLEAQRCRPPVGELLLRQGHVSDDDINRALAEQARSGKLIGEILVEKGAVSQPVLSHALEQQAKTGLETEHGFGTGLRDAIARGGPT
jgi:SOS response regulatory protein OraA/RecX